jgi:hypothetical protein
MSLCHRVFAECADAEAAIRAPRGRSARGGHVADPILCEMFLALAYGLYPF